MISKLKEQISNVTLEELNVLEHFIQEVRRVKRKEIEHKAFEKFRNAYLEFRKIVPLFTAYIDVEDNEGEEFEVDLMEALDDYFRRK